MMFVHVEGLVSVTPSRHRELREPSFSRQRFDPEIGRHKRLPGGRPLAGRERRPRQRAALLRAAAWRESQRLPWLMPESGDSRWFPRRGCGRCGGREPWKWGEDATIATTTVTRQRETLRLVRWVSFDG